MATMIDSNTASRLIAGSSSSSRSIRDVTPISSKQMEMHEKFAKALLAIAQDTTSEEERLNVMRIQNQQLLKRAVLASRSGNKDLLDHIRMQVKANHEQLKFVDTTHKMEKARTLANQKYQDELAEVNRMLKYGESVDENRLLKLKTQEELIRKQEQSIRVRSLAEAKALREGKDMASLQSEIADDIARQAANSKQGSAYAAKMSDQLKELRENAGKAGFEIEGMSRTQALMVHGVGKLAQFVSIGMAIKLAKDSLAGFAEAADSVTEASYRTGESLSRADRGVGAYLGRAKQMASMNLDVGLSFAKMGLDADDAKDIIPKMLAKNSTALRYFKDKNNGALEDMAKSAGAFSRQSGMSVEEAMDFQAELMDAKQMTAKQADEAMKGIAGSFRGINDSLTDAGFKGALLDVGELSKLTAEAAKNADNASFNTETYAKALGKATAASRAFGMSEKSAKEYGKIRADAANSEDKYSQLQRGKRLDTYMSGKYGDEAGKGDAKSLAGKLMAEEKMGEEDAQYVASMLIAKAQGKAGPMYETRLAEAMAGTGANDKAFQANVKAIFKNGNYDPKDPKALDRLSTDPLFLQLYGKQAMDKDARKVALGAWHEYQAENGIAGTHVTTAIPDKKVDANIAKAKAEAGTEGTEANSLTSWDKTLNSTKALYNSPMSKLALIAPVGLGALATNAGVKAATGGRGMLDIIRSMVSGKPMAGAGAGAAADALAPAAANMLPKALGTGTEAATEGASKSSALRRALGAGVKAMWKSRYGKLALGAGALISGAGYMLSKTDTASTQNKLEADATTPEGKALRDKWLTFVQSQPGANVEQAAKMIANGTDPAVAAGYANVSPEAIAAFQNNPTSPNTATYTPPPIADDLTNRGIGLGVNGAVMTGIHVGKKVLGKGAVEGGEKVAAKTGGKLLAKAGLREIPIAGAVLSSLITGAMTDGPMGRKVMSGVGDFFGTLGGQAITGGLGGAVAGTALGEAGSFGGSKLYDAIFGSDSNAKSAVPMVTAATQAPTQTQPTQPGSPAQQGMANIGITGFGGFGNMKADGTIPLIVNVAGLTKAVQQATSFNLATQTQYSGAKI